MGLTPDLWRGVDELLLQALALGQAAVVDLLTGGRWSSWEYVCVLVCVYGCGQDERHGGWACRGSGWPSGVQSGSRGGEFQIQIHLTLSCCGPVLNLRQALLFSFHPQPRPAFADRPDACILTQIQSAKEARELCQRTATGLREGKCRLLRPRSFRPASFRTLPLTALTHPHTLIRDKLAHLPFPSLLPL